MQNCRGAVLAHRRVAVCGPLERAMRGHLHALSALPFPHWSARFYEIDAQSSTLRLWHDEAASASTRETPRQCTPLYLVDAATIEMPPPKSAFAARLVLTLCKGTAEQTTISFAHEDLVALRALQTAILGLAVTVPATCAALAQSSALRLAAQRPAMQGWLLKRREVMAGWRRRACLYCGLCMVWGACTMHGARGVHTTVHTPRTHLHARPTVHAPGASSCCGARPTAATRTSPTS